MKRLFIVLTIALFVAGAKNKKQTPSLDTYHDIHEDKVGLDCEACHIGDKYPDYDLLLSKYKFEKAVANDDMPGVVDRYACIGCHRKGSVGPEWYAHPEK